MASRVNAKYSMTAYTLQGGLWQPIRGVGYPTIGAIVRINGDAVNEYILTAGHAFKDVDVNAGVMLGGAQQGQNNITGLPNADRNANQPDVHWGESRMGAPAPFAQSYLQYHCPSDKLGSTVDAGLARIVAGQTFTNTLRNLPNGVANKTMTTLETAWPPTAFGPGEVYLLGGVTITNLTPHANWASKYKAWNGATPSNMTNVLVRPSPIPAVLTPAMSGSPLIRADPNGANAVLVAIVVGVAELSNDPAGQMLYEVYQHVSAVVPILNLQVALP